MSVIINKTVAEVDNLEFRLQIYPSRKIIFDLYQIYKFDVNLIKFAFGS